MECKILYFWHILLFYIHQGKEAVEDHKEICDVHGVDCLTESTCHNWLKKFRSEIFFKKNDQQLNLSHTQLKII